MADEATTTADTTEPNGAATTEESDVEKQAFLDRLSKESGKRKEAEKQTVTLQKQIADLTAAMEERESAGLPELERERKRAEQLEKRIAESEKRAEEAETRALNTERSRWIAKAAAGQNFIDPDDASRFVDLSGIESAEDADRAVKRVAKEKKHLIKSEERQLPGQVLANGRTTVAAGKPGGIDPATEADQLAQSLSQFLKSRDK